MMEDLNPIQIGFAREIRRVPEDYQHPKNEKGKLIPLFSSHDLKDQIALYDIQAEKWKDGLRLKSALFIDFNNGLSDDCWVPISEHDAEFTFEEYAGPRPNPEDFMPIFYEDTLTHFALYEITTEGTPLTKPHNSIDALIDELVENNASSYANTIPSCDEWKEIITNAL